MVTEGDLFMNIRNDQNLFLKLMATGLILESAKEKLSLYYEKHKKPMLEMMEDEEAFNLMGAYFEENESELLDTAESSNATADEINSNNYPHFG
ncbi:hypothetical protein AU385_10760 [Bacillus halotolerans]|uniref:hypothetical protein n=1 Tax=Bacillus halotolerans TaxID=260554 RepID=UPI000750107B|nr:hypothetical protein [Bacillus halotolerans]KUP33850.1 hypothetical protein AU385_10760 [Bacillus halotolerans]